MKKENDKMNAVIYARYSCDNQREESIEGRFVSAGHSLNAIIIHLVRIFQ